MIDTGIFFGNLHSYLDFDLILSDCKVPPAEPKAVYIDLPGGNGDLDLTEALGEVKYNDRECEFTFTVAPDTYLSFEEVKQAVSNALNGKSFRITLDKDEDFYYLGRCIVDDYLQDRNIGQIVVKAKVKPYKYRQNATVRTFTLSATATAVNLPNGRLTAIPTIVASNNNATVVFNGTTHTMNAGTHKYLDVQLTEGNNSITISGAGTMTFTYQEGEL